MKKLLLIIILIFFITIPNLIIADDDLEKEKRILNNLKSTLEVFQKKLNETVSYKNTILGEIDEIESKIKDVSLKIANLEKKINETKNKISILENNISLTQIEIDKDKEMIGDKLFLIYKIKNEIPIDIYFSSKTIGELFTRINFLNILIRSNRESLEDLRKKEEILKKERENLEKEKKNLELLLKNNETLKISLIEEEKKRDNLLKTLLTKEEEYKKEIEIYKKKIDEQEEKIQEIIRRAELAKKLPEVGNIIWPVKGPIVSQFGMRIHPIYGIWSFHSGADIDAPIGTPIKAVADGIVIYAGWLGSYGIVVFLKHGGNVSTVYAHMQYFTVELNQYVSQGDIIGYVGNTGLSTGPHLHFEIRIDGKPVDPQKWLP
ncbi:MAG: peptidoglycan DD-metalloendopeptidase family protein [Caldisericia bacterium]|nr:peptidoglycan DD-metalloendopeptidase family protein [Caldisericia bacterium]